MTFISEDVDIGILEEGIMNIYNVQDVINLLMTINHDNCSITDRIIKMPVIHSLKDDLSLSNEAVDLNQCEKLLYSNNYRELSEYVQKIGGSPIPLRSKIWHAYANEKPMYLVLNDLSFLIYRVQRDIQDYKLLTDYVIKADVKEISNDDSYFVFEDLVVYILLLWTRDPWNYNHVEAKYRSLLFNNRKPYPPNGITPFRELCYYVLPLCFIESKPSNLYHLFRSMYARYFCHLHVVSSHPNSILNLMALFETSNNVFKRNTTVLEQVAEWMIKAYVGYLDVKQILLLWDFILVKDDMTLLVKVALNYLKKHEDRLLEAKDLKKMLNNLWDNIQVIDLMNE
jgi:hypothetical protein